MEGDSMISSHRVKSDKKAVKKAIENLVASEGRPSNTKSILSIIINILCAAVLGLAFGFLMNKGTVFLAPTIRQQMLFQRYAMLKMFLSAVGVSMLSVALLELVRKVAYGRVLAEDIEDNCRRGVLHYILGGSLIGLGMVVCGSCPGTIYVQVGSGILNSLFTCLGALLGTYFYYIVVDERICDKRLPANSLVFRRLSDLLHIPSVVAHAIFGFVLLGAAIGLEFIIPWRSDLDYTFGMRSRIDSNRMISSIFGMAAWPPAICGAGVGLLQLFFILGLRKTLGASSAFSVLASQICRVKSMSQKMPSLATYTYGVDNYTTFLYALAAICGSALSSTLSQTIPLGPQYGTNVLCSISGGFLLFLGARIAGGCTSGQGISGMTHLLLGSFLTTACIFGSGILFGLCFWLSKAEWFFQYHL